MRKCANQLRIIYFLRQIEVFKMKLTILILNICISFFCIPSFSQTKVEGNNDDTLKYYDYSNRQNSDPLGIGNNLIVTDPNTGKIIFDQRDGVPNIDLYNKFTNIGDELFIAKNYKVSSGFYEKALIVNLNNAKVKHRLNLAICYCKLEIKDSAFIQLSKIAFNSRYYDYKYLEGDPVFKILRSDPRWKPIISKIKENALTIQKDLNNYIPEF